MAYWNRYDEEDEDRDFESGNRYNRGGFSREQDPSQRGSWHSSQGRGDTSGRGNASGRGGTSGRDYDRTRQRQSSSQNRGRDNQSAGYDTFGEQYGENNRTWSSEDRDWDYGYPRDYGQNRDYRRDYQQDYDRYSGQSRQNGRRNDSQKRDNRQNSEYSDQHQGSEDRGRYERDQYNRYNVSGYNDEEEYYGLGYRPTNYNPHHPDRMPGREIPVAGMQSDFGGNTDYGNPNSGRSVYQRGDVGYDNEGAFYQDMDEPINNEMWPSWEGRGRHYGKGPANYRRSDSRIQDDICERFTRHGRIDATDIDVTVDNGVATLKGAVPTREMKRLAEDAAADITGVKDVDNQIKVSRQQNWDRGDRSMQEDYQGGGRQHSGQRSASQTTSQTASQTTIGGTPALNPDRDFEDRADYSPAGQSNVGAGLTSEGATSLEGMEAAENTEENKHGLREGMEVIGRDGKVLGRVKEIRQRDFLLDREMSRDLYVPYSALQSVSAQAMLNIESGDIDTQHWDKPAIV